MVVNYPTKLRKCAASVLIFGSLSLGFIKADTDVVYNKDVNQFNIIDNNLPYQDFMVQFFIKIEQAKLSLKEMQETCKNQPQRLVDQSDLLDDRIQKFKDYENTRVIYNTKDVANEAWAKISQIEADNKESVRLFYQVLSQLFETKAHGLIFCGNYDYQTTESDSVTIQNLMFTLDLKQKAMVSRLVKEMRDIELLAAKKMVNETLKKIDEAHPNCILHSYRHLFHRHTRYCRCQDPETESWYDKPLEACKRQ